MSIFGAATMRGSHKPLILDITNTASPNIPNLLSAAGWKGLRQPVIIENSALVNTLVIPNTLAGADITILNKSGARIGGVKNSGTALRTQIPIKVDNQGTISGGGGRGRNASTMRATYKPPNFKQQIFSPGISGPGAGQGFRDVDSLVIDEREIVPISPVQVIGGGASPTFTVFGGTTFAISVTPPTAGRGGTWGELGGYSIPGGPSYAATGNGWANYPQTDPITDISFNSPQESYDGSLAGYYIDGDSLVTWINTGIRLGRVKA